MNSDKLPVKPWNKGLKLPVEILSEREVNQLVNAVSRRGHTGVRNRALISLIYRTGLRISEALALSVKDVDTQGGTVRVLHGKGNKARTTAIDPGGAAIVDVWLAKRVELGIPRAAPLFCTLAGGRMSDRYVRAMVKRVAARAGLDKRVHPHGLRHTHASELAREGVPVNVIQSQLGHSNLSTTSTYLNHISPAHLVTVIQRRTWNTGESDE